MSQGRGEAEWSRAKAMTAWIRGAWVKEPMPDAAMNPYRRSRPVSSKVKLRLFIEGMRAKHGRR